MAIPFNIYFITKNHLVVKSYFYKLTTTVFNYKSNCVGSNIRIAKINISLEIVNILVLALLININV